MSTAVTAIDHLRLWCGVAFGFGLFAHLGVAFRQAFLEFTLGTTKVACDFRQARAAKEHDDKSNNDPKFWSTWHTRTLAVPLTRWQSCGWLERAGDANDVVPVLRGHPRYRISRRWPARNRGTVGVLHSLCRLPWLHGWTHLAREKRGPGQLLSNSPDLAMRGRHLPTLRFVDSLTPSSYPV